MDLPEHLELALTYADESSKRGRWIIFILQLAAVLVFASVWQESDFAWLSQRLTVAQNAVILLTCKPETVYAAGAKDKQLNQVLGTKLTQITSEAVDDAYRCSGNPLMTPEEERQARAYLKSWNYSLTQAKKNVSDLQQLVGTRIMGVAVPILGITFDVNDLSVISGITFSILLSWLYFALRRHYKNTQRVFEFASAPNEKLAPAGTAVEPSLLETIYYLMRMTQVLTIVPGKTPDSRNISFLRRFSRLPNLILWTAALAEMAVLVEDLITMDAGDDLNQLVSRSETAIAVFLFIYIIYRTFRCLGLLRDIDAEWARAWNKFSPEDQHIPIRRHNKLLNRLKNWKIEVTAVVLGFAIIIHVCDDWRPGFLMVVRQTMAGVYNSFINHLSIVVNVGERITSVIFLVLVVLLLWNVFGKRRSVLYRKNSIMWFLAWVMPVIALIEVCFHTARTFHEAAPEYFRKHMEGFYSSPTLLIASVAFLFLLSERRDRSAVLQTKPLIRMKQMPPSPSSVLPPVK